MLIIDQRDITARSPDLRCGFWEGAHLIASTVSVPPSPPPPPPATSARIPGTDGPQLAGDPGSSAGEGPDPAPARRFPQVASLLGSSPHSPQHPRRPKARSRGDHSSFRPSPGQLASSPRSPDAAHVIWALGRRVLVCLFLGVDGDKVDAFEKPNKYFSI